MEDEFGDVSLPASFSLWSFLVYLMSFPLLFINFSAVGFFGLLIFHFLWGVGGTGISDRQYSTVLLFFFFGVVAG